LRSQEGFSLLEAIVAIAICGIILAALASASTSSLQRGREGNHQIQATQILDSIGRRIAGGTDLRLLPERNTQVELGYGEISDFISLQGNRANDYRVTIDAKDLITVGTTSSVRYEIQVCFETGQSERCVRGVTLGREP